MSVEVISRNIFRNIADLEWSISDLQELGYHELATQLLDITIQLDDLGNQLDD